MNPFSLILVVFLFTACSSAEPPQVESLEWKNNWLEAVAEVQENKKLFIAEFSTEWCPYCKYVKERIFPQQEVTERLVRFVRVRLDGDLPEIQPLMDKFDVRGFPTYLLLDPDLNEIARWSVVADPMELVALLKRAEESQPGFRELSRGEAMMDRGDAKSAALFYKKAYEFFRPTKDHLLEEAVLGLLKTDQPQKEEKLHYIEEMITLFPDSPKMALYYNQLAELYTASALQRTYRIKAAQTIETRLNRFHELSSGEAWDTAIHLIPALAKLYEKLDRQRDIAPLFLKGARICRELSLQHGGVKFNQHIVPYVGYFFIKAGEPERAVYYYRHLLKERDFERHWPVLRSYAQALVSNAQYDEAIKVSQKAYDLAEPVAKPKVAMVWAEAEASRNNFTEAIAILKRAEGDLVESGHSESGRSKVLLQQLQIIKKDYASL